MLSRKKKTFFEESAINNAEAYSYYYNRLCEIALSRFKWINLPLAEFGKPGMDARYLEMTLQENGGAVLFLDEVLGFLALPYAVSGNLDVYRNPVKRRAYASNGFNLDLTNNDSVLVFNNYLKTPDIDALRMFARRLANISRTIDVNVNAQKTPVLIECDEVQRLTMKNLYMQFDGNAPVIFGRNGLHDGLSVLKTDAPFISDKLYELFEKTWNEALTYLGIANANVSKKERLITDEVQRGMGGTLASRNSCLHMRQKACEEFNKMFGMDIWCDWSEATGEAVEENE